MQHQIHRCANGLTALVAPQHDLPLVSLQLWVETGSTQEGEWAGAGLSHLLEHMVFKGTERFSGRELNERVPELGGLWNAYTSGDRTVFYIDGPATSWREFLELLVQICLHPTFPREEFEREREVIRREMAMCDDDPQDVAYHTLLRTLYHRHPRRLPVIGERAAFDALRYEDMVDYHRRRYAPANMFICAAGDVDPEVFFAAVEAVVADVPPRAVPEPLLLPEPRQWGPRLCRRSFAQPTSTLMLAWRIPPADSADAAPLSLLVSLLGDGRSAWLYKHLHDELGLVHDVSVFALPDAHSEGALVVELDVERERREEARGALLAFMEALPRAEWSRARRRTRRQMRTARLRTLSTVQGMAATLGMSWHLTRNADCAEEWEAALDAVTDADLQRVAAAYLTPPRLTEVSIDPLQAAGVEEDGAEHPRAAAASKVHLLPNGLRLVTRADARVPMVALTFCCAAGCRTESEQTAGLNALMSECLLKGTRSRSAAQLAEAVEDVGASIGSEAGNNTICITLRGPSQDAAWLLELLADVVLHPLFPEAALEHEREAMIADVLDAQEDPVALAFRRLRRACFGARSYGNHRDGTPESLRSLTREHLAAQHARLLCGRNAVLSVAGDIDEAALQATVERLFAALPAGLPAVGVPTPPQKAGEESLHAGKEQAVLVTALPACTAVSPDLPLQLLLETWCRDMSGPLFVELREKRALAYDCSVASLLGTDAGFMAFYVATAPERAEEAREALEELLLRLGREGMPEAALRRAQETALTARLLALQSCDKRSSSVAVNELLGAGADYDDAMPELLRAVTAEQMRAFMARLLAPEAPRTRVSVL